MSSEYPQQPRLAVGVVVVHEDRVLLVKRAKPPSRDQWAVPGGSVELGETLAAAGEREVLEETGVSVAAGEPVFLFDSVIRDDDGRVRYHYLIVDLAGKYLSGVPRAGDDAAAAAWVSREELGGLKLSEATRWLLAEKFDFCAK